ncbi:MAG: hypothetical protein J0M29_01860 [Chitinophagales bacterium]|nr:hypothetical protein [Chitinophagales bacterium]
MDKLRLDIFDIMGYLIPGSAMLMAIWITADQQIVKLEDLYLFLQKISANVVLSGFVVAYTIGFTMHFAGSFIFYSRYPRLEKRRAKVTDNLSNYWALIREHGEKHLPILDRWQALKALAANMSAFCLFAILMCLAKWAQHGYWEWACLIPVFLLLFFAYLNRAKVFAEYLDKDSYAVFESLHLKEKLPENA